MPGKKKFNLWHASTLIDKNIRVFDADISITF